ncbi:hypothetical protein LEP1GSC150_3121 [Leptospira interrogans serovar Copenhageni str. LT2050]|uniref:Uncharacterized protein n=1 Tax=Leptospira interrogans serovar Copenhageni str. LT2050 TaxID=1001598 RepID=M3ICI2_LEPIT|nr:hypothetical protein LEP1GSC150_3121 [Leptospira interrogans serovar Copenhageni str. LT2050]
MNCGNSHEFGILRKTLKLWELPRIWDFTVTFELWELPNGFRDFTVRL